MDREVEFVEENGSSEDLPRGFDVDTNKEVYQFSEANGEPRAARRARESDIRAAQRMRSPKREHGVCSHSPRKGERPHSSCLAAVVVIVAPVAATGV
jgi:hypothetical protein